MTSQETTDDLPHLPRSPRPESRWEVEIVEMSVDGRGVGYLSALVGPQCEQKRFQFLVRHAVPGDDVHVEVEQRRSERVEAKIVEILEPSSIRIEPECRHVGRRDVHGKGCGGCTYQTLSYRHQLRVKERIVRRIFGREGLDPGAVLPVIGADEPWLYRNTMEFSFGDTAEHEFALGMHPSGYRHEIVNLQECHLQSEVASDLVPAVRGWAVERGIPPYINSKDTGFLRTLTIREGRHTGERLVELMTTQDERVALEGGDYSVPAADIIEWFADWLEAWAVDRGAEMTSIVWTKKVAQRNEPTEWRTQTVRGEGVFHEELELPENRRLRFEIGPRAFFQTNTRGAERLYAEVIERAGFGTNDDAGADIDVEAVVDLYCGTGTISLVLAEAVKKVVGVELQEEAVRNARQNAQYNEIDNVDFVADDVSDWLVGDQVPSDCLAVVDPPRSGLSKRARKHLQRLEPERIVYVSCNPEALARDLAALSESGFRHGDVQPVDMFPQTYHIECVVALDRCQAAR